MSDEWIRIDEALQYETSRSLYEGDDPSKGVVYIDGLPIDKMRSNYAFMTTGCYACTDGRYQDATGKQECRACPGGKYSINVNNAWFEPYVINNAYLHHQEVILFMLMNGGKLADILLKILMYGMK